MNKLLLSLFLLLGNIGSFAQQEKLRIDSCTIATNLFWDNWYVQVGVNMNLLFLYGKNTKDVFRIENPFGVVFAVGKWFAPEYGAPCFSGGIE